MGPRLLILDDDRPFVDAHLPALETAFDADVLHSVEGAMPMLEPGTFSAALICVEISKNKGYAVCSAIRKNPALANLKVALISARATPEEYARHRSLKGKADLYLFKSLSSAELVDALYRMLCGTLEDPGAPIGTPGYTSHPTAPETAPARSWRTRLKAFLEKFN